MIDPQVIEKLSSNGATGGTKLKLMKEIAAEHNVLWDPAPFEREIRVDHDDVLVSACFLGTVATTQRWEY